LIYVVLHQHWSKVCMIEQMMRISEVPASVSTMTRRDTSPHSHRGFQSPLGLGAVAG
jgi:hypothetical protein